MTDATLTPLEEAQATIAQLRQFILTFAQTQHMAHHRHYNKPFSKCDRQACMNVRTILERTGPELAPEPVTQSPASKLVLVLAHAYPEGPTDAVLVPVRDMSRAKARIPVYREKGWQHAWPQLLLGPGDK